MGKDKPSDSLALSEEELKEQFTKYRQDEAFVPLNIDGVDRGVKDEAMMEKITAQYIETGEFPDTPPRFLAAEKGDTEKGTARFRETLNFRKQYGMWKMLKEAGPFFRVIKQHYPHFYHFKSKQGWCCYYEKVTKINLPGLKEAGVTLDDMVRHYMFSAEFLWTYLDPKEDGKSITIIDCEGMGISQLTGEVMGFIRGANSFYGRHFPEKAGRIFVINVPMLFSAIWKMVSPFIDPVTVQKVKIVRGKSNVTKALSEDIELSNIPKEYGGTCETPLGEAPEEKALFALQTELEKRASA